VTYLRLSFAVLQFPHRVRNVRAAHDCIPLEYAAGAPTADLHNDRFRDTGAAKIARCGPPKVMEDQAACSTFRLSSSETSP
jgi:hypothetical protein